MLRFRELIFIFYCSGDTEFYCQLINLYVEKVVVYYDHAEFYLNTLISVILKGELDRTLGIGEDETLVKYMTKCDHVVVEALKSIELKTTKEGTAIGSSFEKYKEKKADNPLNKQGLSTFIVSNI